MDEPSSSVRGSVSDTLDTEADQLRDQLADREEELECLRRRLQMMSKSQQIAGIGSWEINPETGRLSISEELRRMFDVDPDQEPTLKQAMETVFPEDLPIARAILMEPMEEGESRSVQIRMIRPDQSIMWGRLIGRMGRPDGKRLRRYGIIQDVSELANTQRDLAVSEERWDLALKGSEDGVWDWDIESGQVHFSDRWKTMLGYSVEEIGSGYDVWEQLVHPEDLPKAKEAVEDYFAGRVTQYVIEYRMRMKNESWCWVLTRGKAIFNDEGKPTRMLGTHTDITANKKQEEAFKRLSLVASKTTTGVVITDSDGCFTWVNKAFERMTGFGVDEIIGRTPGSVLQGPASDPEVVKLMRESVRQGKGFHVEVLNYRKSGVPYWVEVEATPVHEADGTLTSFIAIETDITNRRLDRERIEESERRFRDISNAAGEYIWEHDINGQYTYVTERVKEVLGYAPGEFIGIQNFDLVAEDDRSDYIDSLDAIIRDRRSFNNFEVRTRHKNGGYIWQSVSGVPMYDQRGKFIGYRGAALDVTPRKKIERELSALNERFQLATTSACIGIWEYDVQRNSMVWDPIMHELFRLPSNRFLGTIESWSQVTAPEDLPGLKQTLSAAIENGGNYRLNFRIVWPEGDLRHMTGNVLVLLDDERRATRMIGSCWDITEQKRAEERIIHAKEEAEAANRAKSAFLAMMSHEIRTPMNGVVGMIEAINGTQLSEQQRDYLTTIQTSSESLMTIINDILDYSKVEAGRLEIEDRAIRVAPIVMSAISLFSTHAAGKNLEVVHRIDSSTPEAVRGDETRIRQVLMNLISNAVKFTDRGRVTVKVSASLIDKMRYELHFSVADTGIGLDSDQQAKLFEPFTQADVSTTRRYGGTGLGLAISKRLVSLMGGRIWFESTKLLGTVFHFTVPTIKASPSELPPPPPEARTGPVGYPGKILIAEDNPVNCKVVQFVLHRLKCETETASNGLNAVAMYRKHRFPLILMDVQMPEMDGLEATRVIRAATGKDDTPWIIGLSAAALKEDEAAAREAGMNDFIVKPLKPQDLETALRRAPLPKEDDAH